MAVGGESEVAAEHTHTREAYQSDAFEGASDHTEKYRESSPSKLLHFMRSFQSVVSVSINTYTHLTADRAKNYLFLLCL
jgi:hypothetical protein